ncbi:MAG TPA: hypothetical protein VE964_11650 [Myxococcales bacterium]|nr:hypothetical protein [Myxococcales bacterium]
MLVAIAALLAAASPTPAPAPQPEPARFRSLTAVRVVPDGDEEGSSQAADAVSRPAPQPPASRSWYSLYPGNRFGLLVDAGVPVGLGLSGMFRPWSFLRLEGGINWNYLSFGLRGGVTLLPFEWGITPTLHLEGGHFFPADASRFSNDTGVKLVLQHIPEDYLSASLGLEFGSQQQFVFFLRMGLCWIRSEAQQVAAAINSANPGSNTTAKSSADMSLLVQGPTVSVGVVLYLF